MLQSVVRPTDFSQRRKEVMAYFSDAELEHIFQLGLDQAIHDQGSKKEIAEFDFLYDQGPEYIRSQLAEPDLARLLYYIILKRRLKVVEPLHIQAVYSLAISLKPVSQGQETLAQLQSKITLIHRRLLCVDGQTPSVSRHVWLRFGERTLSVSPELDTNAKICDALIRSFGRATFIPVGSRLKAARFFEGQKEITSPHYGDKKTGLIYVLGLKKDKSVIITVLPRAKPKAKRARRTGQPKAFRSGHKRSR